MSERKRSKTVKLPPLPEQRVVIGLVNKFEVLDPEFKLALNGHPIEGKVYRLIQDIDPSTAKGYYRLHVGRENTQNLDGIFLGSELVGEAIDKWVFDITELTPDNYLDFSLDGEDIKKIKNWFDTNNADLIDLLKKETLTTTNLTPAEADVVMAETIEAVRQMAEKEMSDFQTMDTVGISLNALVQNDRHFTKVLCELIHYLASTVKDKYEATGRPNLSKDYLLSHRTPEATCFNAFKYIQRYDTQGFEKSGNVKDIYKAIHYLLFELQRRDLNG